MWINVNDKGHALRFISPSSLLPSVLGFAEENKHERGRNNITAEIKEKKDFLICFICCCWENPITSGPTLHNQLRRWQLVLYNSLVCLLRKQPFLYVNYPSPPFSPAAVFLGAGRAVRGGGARPQAAGAPGRRRAAEPAAEGARPQGEALPEECPQGCAQGRAGGAGAAGEAEGRRAEGGASPQRHNAGRASARALREHGDAPANATLTNPACAKLPPAWTENWLWRARDCWAVSMSGTDK